MSGKASSGIWDLQETTLLLWAVGIMWDNLLEGKQTLGDGWTLGHVLKLKVMVLKEIMFTRLFLTSSCQQLQIYVLEVKYTNKYSTDGEIQSMQRMHIVYMAGSWVQQGQMQKIRICESASR